MAVASTGIGFVALVGSEFNDSIEEYAKNNKGKEPSLTDYARMAAVDTAKIALERIPFMKAVEGKSALVETVKNIIKSVPKNQSAKFGKELAKKLGTITLDIGEEASQEGIQYAMDYFNREYGTAKDKGFNFDEMYKSMIGGGAAGGFTASVGTVRSTAGGLADKAKYGGALDVVNDNSDLPADELKKTYDRVKEDAGASLATPSADDLAGVPVEPTDAPNVKVEAAVAAAQTKVSEVEDEVAPTDKVTEFANEFDEMFGSFIGELKGVSDAVEKGDGKGENYNEDAFVSVVSNASNDSINTLIEIAEDAKTAGAGPKKLAAMQAKINSVIALTSAATSKEINSIVNSSNIDTSTKVSSVLGSSSATLEHLDAVLGSKDLTPPQREALTIKKEILSSVQHVGKDKLFGTGSKPGVFVWLSRLANGAKDPATLNNINDFVVGQTNKLSIFKKAVAKWDADHNMPWMDPKHPDYKKYNDNPSSLNNKIAYRSYAMKEAGTPGELKKGLNIHYGNSTFDHDIAKTASLLDTLKEEHKSISKLANMLQGTSEDTSQEAYKDPLEPQTDSTGEMTPDEVNEAPKASNEAYKTPSAKEVSKMSINEAKKAAVDLEAAIGDSAPSTEDNIAMGYIRDRINQLESNGTKDTTSQPKKKSSKEASSPKKETSSTVSNKEDTTKKSDEDTTKGNKSTESTDETPTINLLEGFSGTITQEEVEEMVNSNPTVKGKSAEDILASMPIAVRNAINKAINESC
jgi:hypothetical protein